MNLKAVIFSGAFILYPAVLRATRGPQDYGIIMALMSMLYSFPVGLLLICFIISSIVNLKSLKKPGRNLGKTVFIISIIIIFPTILIPMFWMFRTEWNSEMIQLMLGVFAPVLVLTIISAVLARRVNKRSLNTDDDISDAIVNKSDQSGTVDNKSLKKIFLIGSAIFLLLLAVFIFKCCFTG